MAKVAETDLVARIENAVVAWLDPAMHAKAALFEQALQNDLVTPIFRFVPYLSGR
jgi:hypothetical protein